jgi:3-phosphoshikimate 1-carboxyvinyltransferase
MTVPGDVSSAAFLIVAAVLVPDSEVRLEGVSLNPGRTAFLDVLRAMGASIEVQPDEAAIEPVGTIVAKSSALRGIEIAPEQVTALIDEIPALTIAGACASGRFGVRGAKELRVKESDRIAALVEGLRNMGASVEEFEDGLRVEAGKRLNGATVRSRGDHRIAMAMAIAGLVADGATTIDEPECVAVSYPGFFQTLEEATGRG